MILKAAGQQEVGGAERAFFAEEDHGVIGHGLVQRSAFFLPVGNQLGERARVHDRARQGMSAGLAALFKHHDGDILTFFGGQLLQTYGGRQAAGAGADNHYVIFHGLARTVLGQDFFIRHRGCLA